MLEISRQKFFYKFFLNTAFVIQSCIFPVLFIQNAVAQFYSGGDDPSSIKWNQILSDHFKVIYPSEFVSEARRMTSLLEFYYEMNSAGLSHQPGKFPVVLHNHSVYTNGFVAVAPRRMELITTPASDSYSQEHFEQLVLHEFRHVVQVDKLNQGVTRVMKFILGEQAQGAVAGLMPFWYLEGDAVDAETVLSNSGRGRLPSFERGIKAILLEKNQMYSYEKSYYGSYRDFVPSHYAYGYQMVAHARQKYETDIWTKMVDFTARNPYTLYPFYFGLKKYTGLSKSGLYKETIQSLKEHWTEQADSRFLSDYRIINNRESKDFTSYQFPAYINDSLVFALKSGIDRLDKFIVIDSKSKEKTIYTPGNIDQANISISGDIVVWAEYKSNERWENESYTIIKSFNLKSGERKTISRRSRYYSPEISPDAKKIVVTEVSLLNEYSLVILDQENGKIFKKIPSPGNEFLQYPTWNKSCDRIFITSMGTEGKSIKSYDLITGEWKTIFNPVFDDIAELTAGDKYLLFRGSFSGIDNIYALELSTMKCYQVTSSKLGAYWPCFSANGDKILYSNYTSRGFDIAETEFNENTLDPFDLTAKNDEQLYKPAINTDLLKKKAECEQITKYPEKKYSRIGHLFNVHSWSPFYFDYENPDIENPSISPGVTILSQNIINTAFTTLGYEYRDHDHYIHASFTYRGLYPIFRISYDFGGLPFIADPPEGNDMPDWVLTNMNWNFKVYVPLNLSSGKYVVGLQPSAESRFSRSYLWYDEPAGYRTGLTFLNYRLYIYSYLKTSKRDILPRWGQVADINFVHAPFNTSQVGSEVSLNGTLYLPGFLQHHTLRLGAGFMNQKAEKYILNNLISMSRGYESFTSEEFIKLTADYVFPVIYPDLNIWHLLYIKRIKAAIFYDHGLGYNVHVPSGDSYVSKDLKFRSFGFDLTSDFHLAHILFPFDMGVRFSYPLDDAKPKWELLMSIDINDFR
jgi:hypothetical protein